LSRIIAIDYGRKRCGIAVTDPLKMFAQPLTTISPEELIPFLKNYFLTEEVDVIVLGKPLTEKGENQEIWEDILKLEAKLKEVFPQIPVSFIDERYTSRMAGKAMIEAGIKKSKRRDKKLLDTISAALILQTYLQMNS
jgi:putative holliday junction resolvase